MGAPVMRDPFNGLCFAPRIDDGIIRSKLSSLGLTCFWCRSAIPA